MNPTRSLPTPVPEPPVHAPGRAPKPVGHRVAVPAGSTSVDVAVSDRTRQLLDGPIVPTLLRLAAPNVVVMTVQVAVTAGEAYFLGWLGADALAGVSLTFPLIMLMQTMSAGGMGGGVSAAVARALGAGRRRDADALGFHALLIATVMGAGFTGALVLGGPALYRAMGGTGGALAAALAYSNIVFGGAIAVWLFNTLASIVRGTGNMLLPASVVVGGAVLTLGLSPALIFGWGPGATVRHRRRRGGPRDLLCRRQPRLARVPAVRSEPRPARACGPSAPADGCSGRSCGWGRRVS